MADLLSIIKGGAQRYSTEKIFTGARVLTKGQNPFVRGLAGIASKSLNKIVNSIFGKKPVVKPPRQSVERPPDSFFYNRFLRNDAVLRARRNAVGLSLGNVVKKSKLAHDAITSKIGGSESGKTRYSHEYPNINDFFTLFSSNNPVYNILQTYLYNVDIIFPDSRENSVDVNSKLKDYLLSFKVLGGDTLKPISILASHVEIPAIETVQNDNRMRENYYGFLPFTGKFNTFTNNSVTIRFLSTEMNLLDTLFQSWIKETTLR